MAKHILFDYTFDPSQNTITLDDTYDQKRFLVITNVTDNVIIYNFADPAFGATFEYKYDPVQTIITLDYDTSAMSADDSLQIFYDADKQSFAPADEYLDPVSKIRVSNPENLIDTDFEYGLQSTKWETIELTSNIPTFFSRNGDADIKLTAVDVTNGSTLVRVETELQHDLLRGAPIFIQGTDSILCDGGFIVKNVESSTVFTYESKGPAAFTGSILDTYTQMFSASIYDGTEFKLSNTDGISTDGANPSEVTVSTEFPTNFANDTKIALTNSFAKATVELDTDDVIHEDSNSSTYTATITDNEGLEYTANLGPLDPYNSTNEPTWPSGLKRVFWFDKADISIDSSTNIITFPEDVELPYNYYAYYGKVNGEGPNWTGYNVPLGFVYMGDPTNTPIDGMQYGASYWLQRLSSNTCRIQQQQTTSSNYTLSLSGAKGTNGNFMRDGFMWAGTITASYAATTDYFYHHADAALYGSPESVDYSYTNYNFPGTYATLNGVKLFENPTYNMPWNHHFRYAALEMNGAAVPSLYNMYGNTLGNTNAYENTTYLYMRNYYFSDWRYVYFNYRSGFRYRTYNPISSNNYNDYCFIPVQIAHSSEIQKTRFYFPGHNFTDNDQVTYTQVSGTVPSNLAGSTTLAAFVSDQNNLELTSNWYSTGTVNWAPSFSDVFKPASGAFSYTIAKTDQKQLNKFNRIKIGGESLNDGDKVKYVVGSGNTAIGGLTDDTDYFVINKTSDNYLSLQTTAENVTDARILVDSRFSVTTGASNSYITNNDFTGLSAGDAVEVDYFFSGQSSNRQSIYGLPKGVYFISKPSSTQIKFHRDKANAVAGTNVITLVSPSVYSQITTEGQERTMTIKKVNVLDLTSAPSDETHTFEADFIGAADGNYTVASTASDQESFVIQNGTKITARTLSLVAQESFVADEDAFHKAEHGFITGQLVTVTLSGTTNISGITSGDDYYIIEVNRDFFQLATTADNAEAGTAISLTETGSSSSRLTGTILFEPTDLVGRFDGGGTISLTSGSKKIVGTDTSFTSFFQKGDTIYINNADDVTTGDISSVSGTELTIATTTSSSDDGKAIKLTGSSVADADILYMRHISSGVIDVYHTRTDALADTNPITVSNITGATFTIFNSFNSWITATIENVNDDQNMTVETAFTVTEDNLNYALSTKLILRPDGFALHRPYDGGVELIAPKNPDSQMVRQTRKYFRYQSGKGIQVSFAVNFAPSTQIDTFTRSGTTGTVTTRHPHRLSENLNLTISGATNADETIGTKVIDVTVVNVYGSNRYYYDNDLPSALTFYEGRTYRLDASDSSADNHPIVLVSGVDLSDYETGVTYYLDGSSVTRAAYLSGFASATTRYLEITVATDAPSLETKCTNHSNMGVPINTPTDTNNNQENLWNGSHTVNNIVDERTFEITLDGTPSDPSALGSPEYVVPKWTDCKLRCGLFDDQNGLFFEYDGDTLYACIRSSTKQLRGNVSVAFRSGQVNGTNTAFQSELTVGENIVIKGQTYKVTKIDSNTTLFVAPSYRGTTKGNVIISKVDTRRVPQTSWNIDKMDGKGKSGFKLDLTKIQMAYIDYSWYGAGKVRFGFKDQNGNVKYAHAFAHGNYKKEAYMRSGNIPARYELLNGTAPTYTPALAHWGTSVIMDGRFDPDKAYLFNAASQNITITGEDEVTVSARAFTTNKYVAYYQGRYTLGYALELQSPDIDAGTKSAGEAISGANLTSGTVLANPELEYLTNPYVENVYTYIDDGSQGNNPFKNSEYRNLIILDQAPSGTTTTFSDYTLGAAGSAQGVNDEFPLISIRLAPSVDTSAPGFLGDREIINRMQLILNQVGILTTHALSVSLRLNAKLNTNDWQRVDNPSLSQLIYHQVGDTVSEGQAVFNFEASGGSGTSSRQPNLTTVDLGDIATLGNAILGGDNTYPDGPDVLTVVATLNEEVSSVSASNPFITSARVSWSESQA